MQDGSRCLGRVASWWSPFLHVSLYPVLALALPGTQTRFSQEPADQTVVAGQRAVLPCVLLNYSGIVQWTKDGLALGMGQGLKGEWGCPASPTSRLPRLCTHTSPYPSPDRFLDSVSLSCTSQHLFSLLQPLFSCVCESGFLSLVLSSVSTAFQTPQLCLPCNLWTCSKKAVGSLRDQRKPRDLYVKDLQTDRQTDTTRTAVGRQR